MLLSLDKFAGIGDGKPALFITSILIRNKKDGLSSRSFSGREELSSLGAL